jgi:ATP-dependent Lon protease
VSLPKARPCCLKENTWSESKSESRKLAESAGYTEIAMTAEETPTPEQTPPAAPVAEPTAGILEEMPVLTVRDTVIFPGAMLPITVGRPSSVALVNSLGENRLLAVVSQLDPRVDTPGPEDLYQVGTVCVMHKAIRVPKDNLLLFCEGLSRLKTTEYTATERSWRCGRT